MVGAYAVGVLAVFCFFAAMREWPMPLAGDRPHRREAHTLVQQDPAETGSAGDVALTPRQFGDKLVLDVRNNGPAASFTAEVIFIFRSNRDGTPDTTPGWAVPWAANGKPARPQMRLRYRTASSARLTWPVTIPLLCKHPDRVIRAVLTGCSHRCLSRWAFRTGRR